MLKILNLLLAIAFCTLKLLSPPELVKLYPNGTIPSITTNLEKIPKSIINGNAVFLPSSGCNYTYYPSKINIITNSSCGIPSAANVTGIIIVLNVSDSELNSVSIPWKGNGSIFIVGISNKYIDKWKYYSNQTINISFEPDLISIKPTLTIALSGDYCTDKDFIEKLYKFLIPLKVSEVNIELLFNYSTCQACKAEGCAEYYCLRGIYDENQEKLMIDRTLYEQAMLDYVVKNNAYFGDFAMFLHFTISYCKYDYTDSCHKKILELLNINTIIIKSIKEEINGDSIIASQIQSWAKRNIKDNNAIYIDNTEVLEIDGIKDYICRRLGPSSDICSGRCSSQCYMMEIDDHVCDSRCKTDSCAYDIEDCKLEEKTILKSESGSSSNWNIARMLGSGSNSNHGKDSGSNSDHGKDSGSNSNHGKDSGSNSNPGKDSGSNSNPGKDSGSNSNPGKDSGSNSNPGKDSGSNSNPGSGSNPGKDPGSNSNPGSGSNPGSNSNPGQNSGSNPNPGHGSSSNSGKDSKSDSSSDSGNTTTILIAILVPVGVFACTLSIIYCRRYYKEKNIHKNTQNQTAELASSGYHQPAQSIQAPRPAQQENEYSANHRQVSRQNPQVNQQPSRRNLIVRQEDNQPSSRSRNNRSRHQPSGINNYEPRIDQSVSLEQNSRPNSQWIAPVAPIQNPQEIQQAIAFHNQYVWMPPIQNLQEIQQAIDFYNQYAGLPHIQNSLAIQQAIIFYNQYAGLPPIQNLREIQQAIYFYNQFAGFPPLPNPYQILEAVVLFNQNANLRPLQSPQEIWQFLRQLYQSAMQELENLQRQANNPFQPSAPQASEASSRRSSVHEVHNCPICLDDIDQSEIKITACMHIFHENCLRVWIENGARRAMCPICRASLS
ncbi:unnamed protein product [Blepharisma stoltei]|uniref:RING-type domain-containing protein n=1 Tax=Blepharisma stoltei TaxID=1481888 RepID=A0AAU9JN01_9CILI|nr:unnamed protein product [Blepharisma stoltei]